MKISVIYSDQSRGAVREEELQGLIQSNMVISFQRQYDDWVKIGVDPIRGTGGRRYRGPERRGDVISNC